ncbi:proton-conducting transporter transmembrane domain-containing protein [Streptomyces albireticuli]|uniref:proton-conducting transporter transmembrane domain-containing protein n=1 Tax=Streptomyces albireticuli TaxID=1940 RepID=UPI0036CE0196
MTHATTALLLTAPVAVPLAACAAHAVAGARPRTALRPPAPRAAALAPAPAPTAGRTAGGGGALLTAAPGEGAEGGGGAPAAGKKGPPREGGEGGDPGARGGGGLPAREDGLARTGGRSRPLRADGAGGRSGTPRTGRDAADAPVPPPTDPASGMPAFTADDPAPGPGPRTGGTAEDAPRRPSLVPWLGLASPLAILACGAVLAAELPGAAPLTACGRLLRADALTAWMLLVVGAVATVACAATPAHLAHERPDAPAARRYHLLVHAFLAAMSAAVLAADLGVLWVAVEATTLVTAFLVGHRRTRASVEAAWKYMVICSAGIALALLGTVLIYYAARQAGVPEPAALDWTVLAAHADRLDPDVTRLAVGLVVLGFGAKAGLAPLHAWLPDAHSQAPAPVSALMSGVLLSVAFAGLLRYKTVADAALGPGYTRGLLAGCALLTLALATALLLGQRDYKRMLAYSSMEHMSLIALAAAVGTPLALAAALLHMAGHGLAKAVAFCASGHVLRLLHTTRVGRVRGLLARAPALGTAFGLAVLALLGLPPFSLFASELGIVRAAFAAGAGGYAAAALALTLMAFAALAARTARMLLGPPPPPPHGDPAGTPVRLGPAVVLPLAAGLLACAVLGVTAGPLTRLLTAAGELLGGR